jgi:hypothetical protein
MACGWRFIEISLIDQQSKRVMAWLQHLFCFGDVWEHIILRLNRGVLVLLNAFLAISQEELCHAIRPWGL